MLEPCSPDVAVFPVAYLLVVPENSSNQILDHNVGYVLVD